MVSAEQQLMDQLRRAREQSEFEDNRTDDIISSVKQQELKYAQLSKQLEEERKTLAEQLEQVELGSETASLRSISESDLGSRTNSLTLSPTPNPNFQYRPHVKVDDYSDTESRSSTAVPAINSSHILNLHPKYISQQQQPTQQSISLPHINSLDHNQNKQVLQEVNQNQSTPDVNNHRRGSEGNRSRGVSSSHSTEATPKSSRRNSPRGPRYNFGVVPAEQRVNIGINQDLEQPVSLPENEQNMRVSRPPSDRRFSGNIPNSYSENVYHPNMPPDRPQLPAVYAGGNFNGGSRYSGRDEFDSGRGGEGEQKYFNDEDAIGFPEQSPSIQFSPPTSLGRGNQLRASRQDEEQQWDSTPDHVYTNGQPPQMARDAMRTPRRGDMGSAGRDSESEGQITPRQQQNSYASYDPRAPGVPRTPGNTGLDQFGQPFHQPTDSDSIQGSVSSYSRNNISNSGNKRQPLGSQHNLNESGLRVPSSASNMQVQTHPYSATHHPHHPATLMIDATSPHAQYINSMSPPESMGQHSPSVHSRTQYPHPAVSATGTPMIFDIGENAHKRDQRWRNPNLIEILEYLDHDDPRIRLNAAAYLQHLTYEDQAMKVKARENRAVNIITKMLDSTEPEMKKHLLGILRNMSFGKGTIENKLEIQRQRLIPMLARMLSTSPDPEIQELCCAILWNISSEPDVKPEIIEHALKVIVDTAVVPESAWLEYERDHNTYLGSDTASLPPSKPSSPQGPLMPPEWSMLFRNATGCLRNLSADRLDYRQTLRQTRHLIDALIHVLNLAILKNEVSGRAVENCICIIRNLTFHLAAELERAGDPRLESAHDMGDHRSRNSRSVSRNSARSDKVGPGCGPKKNKPKSAGGRDDQYRQQDVLSSDPYARGVELLWQPMMANLCIALLRESSNPDTLEAAAGTLQNMCAGAHPWCPRLRFTVRKSLGLPLLRELLATFENDFVIAAVAGALKNICIDLDNKKLIGVHCTSELIKHLPVDIENNFENVYCEKVAFVLLCLKELCRETKSWVGDERAKEKQKVHEDNCRYVLHGDGLKLIIPLAKYRDRKESQSPIVPIRIVKIAEELLVEMWNCKSMRKEYKESNFRRPHFDPRALVGVERTHEPKTVSSTLRKSRAKSADDLNNSFGGTRSRHGTASRGATANRHGGSSTMVSRGGGAGTAGEGRGDYNGYEQGGSHSARDAAAVSPAMTPHSVTSGEAGQLQPDYNNLNRRYSGDNGDNYMQNEYRPQDMMDAPIAAPRGLDPFQIQNMSPNLNHSPVNSVTSDRNSTSSHQFAPPSANHSIRSNNTINSNNHLNPPYQPSQSQTSLPMANNSQTRGVLDSHVYSSIDKQGRHVSSGYNYNTQVSTSAQRQPHPHYMHQTSHAPQNNSDSDAAGHSWV